MSTLVEYARKVAALAHLHHKRKYTGLPYTVHTDEVEAIVHSVTEDEEMRAAAHLHDTVEDNPEEFPLEAIRQAFGERVASLVENLTDVSTKQDGNREARKAIDRKHTSAAHPDAQTIKLADIISNTKDIAKNDPKFAKVYLHEIALLLPYLEQGNAALYSQAVTQLARLHLEVASEA